MSVDNSAASDAAGLRKAATAARRLMRTALKGTLATLGRGTGHPFASLVLVATEPDGTPILLLSRLAQHTLNLEQDSRASLLIDGTSELADPLSGGRVTLVGEVRSAKTATAKPRFLARHPSAAGYAEFSDFSTYTLDITVGHYVGGFGRIVGLSRSDLVLDVANTSGLAEAEAAILAHMNSDHADAVALYATQIAKGEPGNWLMTGIDPEGFDLLHRSNAARIDFPVPVRTPQEARLALVALAKQARADPGMPSTG